VTTDRATHTEDNRSVIRAAFDAWRDGTAAITDVFADDMVWRIEGHSLASKQYDDRQQFIDEVLAPFGARFAAGELTRTRHSPWRVQVPYRARSSSRSKLS
jgi:ketosteroid isomerase-like protein